MHGAQGAVRVRVIERAGVKQRSCGIFVVRWFKKKYFKLQRSEIIWQKRHANAAWQGQALHPDKHLELASGVFIDFPWNMDLGPILAAIQL